ncbi:MAG: DUF420 domain-containing protein [Deltaproteobacteria bacterium]|nr:DUF420 domain-containing protein [Deltaproteobacteria bacterium]
MGTEAILTYLGLALIGGSGLSILTGLGFILSGQKTRHKAAMLTATALAVLFVVVYTIKSSMYPPVRYAGPNRGIYLFILWSHTVLSIINMPLAAVTVYLGLKERFDRHKRIAPYTAGVWIYVAVTGWIIYFFLH